MTRSNGGTRLCQASPIANEKNVSCISLGNQPLSSGYWIAAAVIHQLLPFTMAVAGTTDSRDHDLAH
jgi:hypothetical protein